MGVVGGLSELVDFVTVKLLTMNVLAAANTLKYRGLVVWGRLASNVSYSGEQHSVSSCCWMAILEMIWKIPSSMFPQDYQDSQTRNSLM